MRQQAIRLDLDAVTVLARRQAQLARTLAQCAEQLDEAYFGTWAGDRRQRDRSAELRRRQRGTTRQLRRQARRLEVISRQIVGHGGELDRADTTRPRELR